MLHEATMETDGNVDDIEISLKEFKHQQQTLNKIIARQTDKTVKQIERDLYARDIWFNSIKAIKYKAVNGVWTKERERLSNKTTLNK